MFEKLKLNRHDVWDCREVELKKTHLLNRKNFLLLLWLLFLKTIND